MHTQNKPPQRLISIRPYTHSKQAKHTVPPINTQTIAPKVVCQIKAPHVIRPSTHSKHQRGYLPKRAQNKPPQAVHPFTHSKQNTTDYIHVFLYILKTKLHRRYVPIYIHSKQGTRGGTSNTHSNKAPQVLHTYTHSNQSTTDGMSLYIHSKQCTIVDTCLYTL